MGDKRITRDQRKAIVSARREVKATGTQESRREQTRIRKGR
jgi:hypothetical protein